MTTLELSEAQIAERQLVKKDSERFTLTVALLRMFIEADPSGEITDHLSNHFVIESNSGTSYDITFRAPSAVAIYYGWSAQARMAHYTRTRKNGNVNEGVERIGLSSEGGLKLMFFPVHDMEDDGDSAHSIMRLPMSTELLPYGMKLVVTENSE